MSVQRTRIIRSAWKERYVKETENCILGRRSEMKNMDMKLWVERVGSGWRIDGGREEDFD